MLSYLTCLATLPTVGALINALQLLGHAHATGLHIWHYIIESLFSPKIHFLLMFVAHLAIATYIMAAFCATIV